MFGLPYGQQVVNPQVSARPAPSGGAGVGGAVGGVARQPGGFAGMGLGGAGRSAGMFGQGAPNPSYARMMGGFGAGAAPRSAGSPFGAMRPQQMQTMGMRPPQQQQVSAPSMAQRAAPQMGNTGSLFALSDERSKQKIQELEGVKQRYEDLLDGPSASMPELRDPRGGLDDAFRRPGTYSYEYKDPSMAGAAPGRQVGPMADELRGIPGAVERGNDGFDRVNIPRTTLATVSQVAKQRRELDDLRAQLDALGDSGAISPAESDAVSRSFGR